MQSDPGSIGGGTTPRPERYLVVARYLDSDAASGAADGVAEPRYLFARWADWPFPAMLALAPPALDETLADALARVLWARFAARTVDTPRAGAERTPARMPHPHTGVDGMGWLRAVAVTVEGELAPDALLDGFALLTAQEARGALPSDVERLVFASGLTLFD